MLEVLGENPKLRLLRCGGESICADAQKSYQTRWRLREGGGHAMSIGSEWDQLPPTALKKPNPVRLFPSNQPKIRDPIPA